MSWHIVGKLHNKYLLNRFEASRFSFKLWANYKCEKLTFCVFKVIVDMTLNIKGRAFVQIDVNPLMDNSWGQLME